MDTLVTQTGFTASLVSLLVQTLGYGVFIALVPIVVHSLIQGFRQYGLSLRSDTIIFILTLFVFLLSTADWILAIRMLISQFSSSHASNETEVHELLSSFFALNFVFADSVMVWRMSILCGEQFSKAILTIPSALLCLTGLSACATISVRILLFTSTEDEVSSRRHLAIGLDISQLCLLAFSVLTNIASVGIISIWAWRYRKTVARSLRTTGISSRVQRIMMIVVESGIIYCVSSIILLAAVFVPIPGRRGNRLGNIYAKIHVQSAGIYPAIMKILINWQRSLDSETLISTSLRTLSLDVQPISSRQTTDHTRTKSYRSFSGTRARIRTTRRAWAEMSVQTEGDGQIPL